MEVWFVLKRSFEHPSIILDEVKINSSLSRRPIDIFYQSLRVYKSGSMIEATIFTYWMHIDQPSFLPTTLLDPSKPKLLIYFIIKSDLLESLLKLGSIIGSFGCRIALASTATSASAASK